MYFLSNYQIVWLIKPYNNQGVNDDCCIDNQEFMSLCIDELTYQSLRFPLKESKLTPKFNRPYVLTGIFVDYITVTQTLF